MPTKAVLHLAKAAAMCTCHEYARPPPPIPPFLLVQNQSSKRIAPTDNMWPKSDDPQKPCFQAMLPENETSHNPSSPMMCSLSPSKPHVTELHEVDDYFEMDYIPGGDLL